MHEETTPFFIPVCTSLAYYGRNTSSKCPHPLAYLPSLFSTRACGAASILIRSRCLIPLQMLVPKPSHQVRFWCSRTWQRSFAELAELLLHDVLSLCSSKILRHHRPTFPRCSQGKFQCASKCSSKCASERGGSSPRPVEAWTRLNHSMHRTMPQSS